MLVNLSRRRVGGDNPPQLQASQYFQGMV